jgi:zinc protease
MSSDNKRKSMPSVSDIASIKLDSALKIYRDQFADASGFTVVLVGNIDLKKIKPLLEKYLGSLPATRKAMTWKDDLTDYPSGILDKTIRMGSEPKSQVRIFFTGIRKYDPLINSQLDLLLSAIEIKLRESLREVLGGTYGVSIYGSVSKIPREQYRIGISFGCAPENVQKLSKAALDIIAGVKLKGINVATLQKVKAASRRSFELDLHENTYWLQEISQRSFQQENLYDILLDEKTVQVMTTEDTRRMANEFFNDQRKITIDLIPKG